MKINFLLLTASGRKVYINHLLSAACLLSSFIAISQPAIIGPDCVLTGSEYQYNIKGNITSDAQLCVTGGTIAGTSSSCTTGLGAGYVRIVWSGSKGSVSFKSAEGKASINITVTTPLQPGAINTKKSEIISFKANCSSIACSKATGGGCGANYSYQWQRSLNNLDWEDIPGATAQNLGSLTALTETYFYRRRVTETVSGTVVYSDATVVYVSPDTKGH